MNADCLCFEEEKAMSNKVTIPTKVITGVNTRWSYANVWDPKSINGGAPKYSISLIIPKSDTATINKINAAIQAAFEEGQSKLKGNGNKGIACGLNNLQKIRDGEPLGGKSRAEDDFATADDEDDFLD